MQAYASDRDVFIRSMASRGHSGGLRRDARSRRRPSWTRAGFDLIFIETVGTGQSEVEVAAAADTTVVLEAPEMGDEVQAIKAGLLEVADIVVVNKGDRPGAQRTRRAAPRDARTDRRRAEQQGRAAPAAEASRGAGHDRRDRRGRARSCSPRWTGTGRPASTGPAGARATARAEAQVGACSSSGSATRWSARRRTDTERPSRRSPPTASTRTRPPIACSRRWAGSSRPMSRRGTDRPDRPSGGHDAGAHRHTRWVRGQDDRSPTGSALPTSGDPRRAVAIAALVLSTAGSTLTHLRLPDPTGSFAVGKLGSLLEDATRPASATIGIDGPRQLRIVAWYPATLGTGTPAHYVSDLDTIADGLIASGEVSQLEVSGLALIADPARAAAHPAIDQPAPVVLLSPGNATNVEFYGGARPRTCEPRLRRDRDRPSLPGRGCRCKRRGRGLSRRPATERSGRGDPGEDRRADRGHPVRLDRLETDAAGLAPLAGHLDLSRIGVIGHSNGGIAAAGACADARVDACANVDGQLAGGPFSARQDPSAPFKPFLFLTKETEIHPRLAELFEAGGAGTFRVVIPAAAHDQFTDGAMFEPRVVPMASTADGVITIARGFSRAFFDHELRGAPRGVFGSVNAPLDVQVYVYPLERAAS